jgi:predicted nucleotidyltransferase
VAENHKNDLLLWYYANGDSAMVATNVAVSTPQIAEFCQKWEIKELALFGSVLRSDFRTDSDIDVLVVFADDGRWDLWQFLEAQDELAAIFGRKVDLVEKKNITNPFRRHHILSNMQVIYAA